MANWSLGGCVTSLVCRKRIDNVVYYVFSLHFTPEKVEQIHEQIAFFKFFVSELDGLKVVQSIQFWDKKSAFLWLDHHCGLFFLYLTARIFFRTFGILQLWQLLFNKSWCIVDRQTTFCTCLYWRKTDIYTWWRKKTGPPAILSHCKYSKNSMTELHENWWTSAILYAEHSH